MTYQVTSKRRPVRRSGGEDGYILIAVLFLVAMVLIMLSIAAPKMAADIERDREMELMHRGKQYTRAIKLYYKKFGAYPPNMEALEKSNEIRFLRKRYKDPVTGKDEWHLIHFGENKTPTAIGFFGQPMGGMPGSTLAGTGPGGVGQNPGGSIFGNNGANGGLGGGSSIGGPGSTSSGLFNSGSSNTSPTDPNAGNTASGAAGGATPTDPNAPGGAGSTGTGIGSSGTGTSGTGTSGAGGSIFGSGSSNNNQTFGGGGVIGVESTSPKLAILEYKKKKHFNEWEFVYDPLADQVMISNSTGVGQPMSGAGNSGSGITTPGTFGNQPTNPSLPPQQQQQPQPQQPTPPQ